MRTNAEIISYIKELMAKQKLSSNQLAENTGVAKSTMSRYLNQTNEFPINRADTFARVLHTTPEDLIGVIPADAINNVPVHTYPYMPAHIAAGAPTTVDAITRDNLETFAIPDAVMGRWAGNKEICLMHINGESMNHIIPNGSMIGVQRLDDVHELRNGDIVVFEKDGEYSVKHFFNDKQSKTFSFNPDSSNSDFQPIIYRYEDADSVKIVGKVAVYIVTMN